MKKKLKVTVKPFLNKSLSHREDVSTVKYSLYYQVTFKRKNTQIKSLFEIYLSDLKDLSKKEAQIIDFEIQNITHTVQYQYAISDPNEFTLSGIKQKYQLYTQDLYSVFENYLKKRLLKIIKFTNTEFLPILKFDGFDASFLLLLKAVKILNENFNKNIPVDFKDEIEAFQKFSKIVHQREEDDFNYYSLLDWIDGSAKIELKNKMIVQFEEPVQKIEKTISILDTVFEDTLKFS